MPVIRDSIISVCSLVSVKFNDNSTSCGSNNYIDHPPEIATLDEVT